MGGFKTGFAVAAGVIVAIFVFSMVMRAVKLWRFPVSRLVRLG